MGATQGAADTAPCTSIPLAIRLLRLRPVHVAHPHRSNGRVNALAYVVHHRNVVVVTLFTWPVVASRKEKDSTKSQGENEGDSRDLSEHG
jgi:hypothetical protein